MDNYIDRLFASIKDTVKIQELSIEAFTAVENSKLGFLNNTMTYDKPNKIPKNQKLEFSSSSAIEIVLFNSLAQERIDVVTVHVSKANVEVHDSDGNQISSQVNSIFKRINNQTDVEELKDEFELLFVVQLPPLSLSKYYVRQSAVNKLTKSEVYSGNNDDDISIANSLFLLSFDKSTGLLKYLNTHNSDIDNPFGITFGK